MHTRFHPSNGSWLEHCNYTQSSAIPGEIFHHRWLKCRDKKRMENAWKIRDTLRTLFIDDIIYNRAIRWTAISSKKNWADCISGNISNFFAFITKYFSGDLKAKIWKKCEMTSKKKNRNEVYRFPRWSKWMTAYLGLNLVSIFLFFLCQFLASLYVFSVSNLAIKKSCSPSFAMMQ